MIDERFESVKINRLESVAKILCFFLIHKLNWEWKISARTLFDCFENSMLQHTENRLNISWVSLGIRTSITYYKKYRLPEQWLQEKFRGNICYIETIDGTRKKWEPALYQMKAYCVISSPLLGLLFTFCPVVALLYSIELMCCVAIIMKCTVYVYFAAISDYFKYIITLSII